MQPEQLSEKDLVHHPLHRGPAALAAVLLLSGCASTQTRVLPAYALANGRVHQDVVTVAADGSGGAPVITSLTTYDVSSRRQSVVIARESASAPGVGLAMASGLGGAVISSAAVLGAALILDEDGDGIGDTVVNTEVVDENEEGSGDTVVNASYATSGNTTTRGDAGDIDAISAAVDDCGSDCSASN